METPKETLSMPTYLHALSMQQDYDKNEIYNQWADSYDDYVSNLEYCAPLELVRFINMHKSHLKEFNVLDFGCGTGLLGQELYKFNSKMQLTGVDISENMLDKSRERNLYSKLLCLDITKETDHMEALTKLDAPDDGFNLVMSCGVFLEGHVSLVEIDRMLLKLVKRGGIFAFTVRDSFMELEKEFIIKLQQNKEITILTKNRINYLKDVDAWAIIIKRL